jgi:hypothetical protein
VRSLVSSAADDVLAVLGEPAAVPRSPTDEVLETVLELELERALVGGVYAKDAQGTVVTVGDDRTEERRC